MKNCIRIPRLYIPRKDFETWSVPVCGGDMRERLERKVGDAPSALRFLLPAEQLSGEELEACREAIAERMFRAREDDWIEKLNRGLIFTERTTKSGVRRGIVAALDLEAYSCGREVSPVRPAAKPDTGRVRELAGLRAGCPLEFPHTVVLYRDKRGKLVRALQHEDLELLYDFELMEGGRLKGYFIPDFFAVEIAEGMHTRGEPCFVVAEGNHTVAAAKAHWEALKKELRSEELVNHPARFTLAEFVNVYDEGLTLEPVHRLMEGVEREALYGYLAKNLKCKREGGVLVLHSADAETVQTCDALLQTFARQSGGALSFVQGAETLKRRASEADCAGVLLPAIDPDDVFTAGKEEEPPAQYFTLGEKRYCMEGREISYD